MPDTITFVSDAGDPIGGGRNFIYTLANSGISVTADSTSIGIRIMGDDQWFGSVTAPRGAHIAVGTYANVPGPFTHGTGPAMDWSTLFANCSDHTGSFTIDSLAWSDAVGSRLLGLDMRFDQHCGGRTPALRGSIHWRASDTTRAPGPTATPTGLWTPPAGAIPTAGDFMYLDSDPGDILGGGTKQLIQGPLVVTSSGASVAISGGGYGATFQGMNSISQLQVGYYANATQHPARNPTRPNMDVSKGGIECSTVSGWFAIDRIRYANGLVAAIEMRFEQHCGASTGPLHGAIRWGQF